MNKAIIVKEFTEIVRDGRAIILFGIIGLLLLLGLVTSFSSESTRSQTVFDARVADSEVFNAQGVKNPHSAAHFSRMAHKPVAPLSAFDPGVSAYVGQVVWLEGHYRNPAMFRAAEDATELGRLENFSLAGILTLIIPLLVILLGYGSIAKEREQGTLRQIISSGTSLRGLLLGKFIIVFSISFAFLFFTIVFAAVTSLSVFEASSQPLTDLFLRSTSLLFVYGLYTAFVTATTLFISSLVQEAKNSLLILLGLWTVMVVSLPRLSASIAEKVYPSPRSSEFWEAMDVRLSQNRLDSSSAEYAAAERAVIERAFGKKLTENEIENLAINTRGVRLEVSEVIDSEIYTAAYAELFENYANQKNFRRLLSIFSPTIALQHLSQAFSGTDVNAHEHFSDEAERQRNNIVRVLNEEMIINDGGENLRYLAPPEFWETVPEFEYEYPTLELAWRQSGADFFIILAWALFSMVAMFWLGKGRLEV